MIGERLQELRKDHGLSQEDLAKILGVSHYTVSSYECNRSDPDDKAKVILAKLFDVSVDYMVGLIDEPLSFNRQGRNVKIPLSLTDDDFADVLKYVEFLKYKRENKTED